MQDHDHRPSAGASRRRLLPRLGAAAALLAGLGSTAAGLATGSASASTPASSSGQTLTVLVPAVQDNVDPAKYDNDPHGEYSPEFASTLVAYKPLPTSSKTSPGPSDIGPSLATSWTSTKTGIVFNLRKAEDAEGNVLTAADVAWSIERDIALKDPTGTFLLSLAGVNLKDPVSVLGPSKVELNGSPTPLSLAALEDYECGVISEKIAKAHATASDPWATRWLAGHTASFGPYEVTSFDPSTTVVLTANPHYWGPQPAYTTVIMRAVPDATTRLEAVESGQAQLDLQPGAYQYAQAKADSRIATASLPDLSEDVMFLNNLDKPFNNPLVRSAVSLAINRQALVSGPYGAGTPAVGVIPSTFPQSSIPPVLPYDVAEAKADLKKAGYPNGFSFTLSENPESIQTADAASLAQLLKSELVQVGITVNIQPVASIAEFQTQVFSAESGYQAWLFSDHAVVADGVYLLNLTYWKKGLSDSFGLNDARLNALIEKGLATPIGSAREQVAAQAETLVRSLMPTVPLVQNPYLVVAAKGITGFVPNVHDTVLFDYLKP